MKKQQTSKDTKSKNLVSNLKGLFTKKEIKNLDFSSDEFITRIKKSGISDPLKLTNIIEGKETPKWTINYLVYLWKSEVKKYSVLLIRMILRDGKIHTFSINPDKPFFMYQKGAYVLDSARIKEDISSSKGCLLYHQGCSIPLGTLTDIEATKELVYDNDNDDIREIRENINPNILRATVLSTLITQVMAGGLLDKQLRSFFLIMIINLVLTAILIVGVFIGSLSG